MIEIVGNVAKITCKVNFIGILIDDRLPFKNHVRSFQKQLSMVSGILNRDLKLVPIKVKLKP